MSCVVQGCYNRTSYKTKSQIEEELYRKISFHRFPKNPRLRDLWIKQINRENFNLTSSTVICSDHFTEDCIDRTSVSTVQLLQHAVPTIFPSMKSKSTQNKPLQCEYEKNAIKLFFNDDDIPAKFVEADILDSLSNQSGSDPMNFSDYSVSSELLEKVKNVRKLSRQRIKAVQLSNKRLQMKIKSLKDSLTQIKNIHMSNNVPIFNLLESVLSEKDIDMNEIHEKIQCSNSFAFPEIVDDKYTVYGMILTSKLQNMPIDNARKAQDEIQEVFDEMTS